MRTNRMVNCAPAMAAGMPSAEMPPATRAAVRAAKVPASTTSAAMY